MNAQSHDTPATAATDASALLGATLIVPLNRLKASPRNARKTPHATAAIEALAASIKAKGVLQPPVVEIERKADGTPSGAYLVTIGEGRRQALRLLAKRTAIKRTHPVRVTVDETNDAHEISLDENVTREAMHPADQFEAFRRVSEEKGWGAEEIGARFGVSAQVVRQRLRLGAVASELIAAYRAGDLSLEQLMAFGVSDDGVRQRQVFEQVGPHAPSHAIRRAMTETKVRADDRRARFVGAAAYEAAGGVILRDLFTEDGGGWLEDPALLDRLAAEKLADLAEDAREREGWAWAEAHADFPHGTGYGRVWPEPVERSEAEVSTIAALAEAYDAIIAEAGEDGLTPEQDARLEEIDNALQDHGPDVAYRPDDLCRSGLIVTLGHDGLARFERGLVRAEDALRPSDPDATKAGLGSPRRPPSRRPPQATLPLERRRRPRQVRPSRPGPAPWNGARRSAAVSPRPSMPSGRATTAAAADLFLCLRIAHDPLQTGLGPLWRSACADHALSTRRTGLGRADRVRTGSGPELAPDRACLRGHDRRPRRRPGCAVRARRRDALDRRGRSPGRSHGRGSSPRRRATR